MSDAAQQPGPQSEAATDSPLRFVTAASLFDGHDAAINIMRRLIQAQGCEVVHLGHNRSVLDIVRAAIQEDADAIAVSSYQGGHNEYFRFMIDQLRERGAGHIKVFAGGGGTITLEEIAELQDYGVERIYHPDDGMDMGLVQMIQDVVQRAGAGRLVPDKHAAGAIPTSRSGNAKSEDVGAAPSPRLGADDGASRSGPIAATLTALEDEDFGKAELKFKRREWQGVKNQAPVIGITGTGGAGKSSVTDEILNRLLTNYPDKTIAVLAVDPTRRRTGGALLGDRIRMNSLRSERVYMRSMATRRQHLATSAMLKDAITFLKSAGFDLVIVETAGIGQSDSEIVDLVDLPVYVMTSDFGAQSQLEKIDMLDFADLIVLNKYDKRGAEDALRDVRKQWKRNHTAFDVEDEDIPVYPTIASQFNDPGLSWMFVNLIRLLRKKGKKGSDPISKKGSDPISSKKTSSGTEGVSSEIGSDPFLAAWPLPEAPTEKEPRATVLIPPARVRYLAEIAEQGRDIAQDIQRQAQAASLAQHYYECLKDLEDPALPQPFEPYPADALLESGNRGGGAAPTRSSDAQSGVVGAAPSPRSGDATEDVGAAPSPRSGAETSCLLLRQRYNAQLAELSAEAVQLLKDWPARKEGIRTDEYSYEVRGKKITGANYRESLSRLQIPKIGMPRDADWGALLSFLMRENLPGAYPYTAGVYPYRRTQEDPIRMFAGEGTPERTNRRFHYVSRGHPAARLSTAFDSVTLYGEDPHTRPDIYGKVGNSGVSIATLDDMKKLYSGFDLCAPTTSVSMTINGPAPMILAFFMNAAIDQQVEKHLDETGGWDAARNVI
jgi:methylmalonyl-CoA mutase